METEVDVSALLEPIPGDHPAGVDLRDDDDPNNIFRRVKDARNDARQEENQSDLDGQKSAEAQRRWRDVWNEGTEYLRTQAKDLEIAAYLIEASIRLNAFRGLSTAIEITTELVNQFWGELLPTPDEDGIETTILPISRLNGDVIVYPIQRIAVTEDGSFGELVVWQYQQAQQLESMDPEEREVRISRGAVTLSQFEQAVAETSPTFYSNLYADLLECRSRISQLDTVFNEKAGYEFAPNFSKFTSAIDDAESVLKQIAGDKLVPEEPEEEVTEESPAVGEVSQAAASGAAPAKKELISSRDDALALLEKVAQWIESHEPQSLLPWEIRKVIKRGKMSPQELYQDLIPDSDARRVLYRDVGIDVPEEESY